MKPNHLFLILLLLFMQACAPPVAEVIRGNTMGTTYSVKYIAEDIDRPQLAQEIAIELKRINGLMSTYQSDSELSIFNQSAINEWQALSDETMAVLKLAKNLHSASAGQFDVTVGPLVNLWGFGPDPLADHVPEQVEIDRAKARVGMDLLEFQATRVKRTSDVYVDLSAIAKGYGVDSVVGLLEQAGISRYLVEIGGELRARGMNDRDQYWRIAVESPETIARQALTTLPVKDQAVATSGDYRNYFEKDGKRYSHTINPRTGYPITHQLASVTVLAATCAEADGLATALNVMGPVAGLALAERKNIAALFIIKGSDDFEEVRSGALMSYLEALNSSETAP